MGNYGLDGNALGEAGEVGSVHSEQGFENAIGIDREMEKGRIL